MCIYLFMDAKERRIRLTVGCHKTTAIAFLHLIHKLSAAGVTGVVNLSRMYICTYLFNFRVLCMHLCVYTVKNLVESQIYFVLVLIW